MQTNGEARFLLCIRKSFGHLLPRKSRASAALKQMKKSKSTGSYSHILKYTSIFGGVQGLGILIGMVRNKLVALLLGPGGMGLVALFTSTIKLVSDSTNLGLAMSAVREIAAAVEQKDEQRLARMVRLIRSWCLITALAGMLLCVFLSPLLNSWTFTWGNHTLHFILLSPIVALTAVTGGELAILKGMHRLRALAEISIYGIIAALLTSVPLYYVWGETAIIPSLLIIAVAQLLLTIGYSYRCLPFSVSFQRHSLGAGVGMVKLGISFVVAGIFGSGAEFIVRSYLNTTGGLDEVGLYNAGYMMTMTYAGMVFSAMETDYFPRLSAVKNEVKARNILVNRQVEVSLLLIAPLMVAFMIGIPLLLPLMYSQQFVPIMGMMQIAVFAMYMRAFELPVAYLSLARGDSRSYLILEAAYYLLFIAAVIVAHRHAGLFGVGVAFSATGVLFNVVLYLYAHRVHRYRLSPNVLLYLFLQVSIGIIAYVITQTTHGAAYWLLGALPALASAGLSYYILRIKTKHAFPLRK